MRNCPSARAAFGSLNKSSSPAVAAATSTMPPNASLSSLAPVSFMVTNRPRVGLNCKCIYPSDFSVSPSHTFTSSTKIWTGYERIRQPVSFRSAALIVASRSSSYFIQPDESRPSFFHSESSLSSKLFVTSASLLPAVAAITSTFCLVTLKELPAGVAPRDKFDGCCS